MVSVSLDADNGYPDIAKFDISTADHIVSLVGMGRDDVTISCTHGKMTIWFGKKATIDLVKRIIAGVSSIDSSVECEKEIICSFDDIQNYQMRGYTLVSYAKTKIGYRAIFNIPFSKKEALEYFALSVFVQLQKVDVKNTLFWDGSVAKIMLLFDELHDVDGWHIKRVDFKKDAHSVQPDG